MKATKPGSKKRKSVTVKRLTTAGETTVWIDVQMPLDRLIIQSPFDVKIVTFRKI